MFTRTIFFVVSLIAVLFTSSVQAMSPNGFRDKCGDSRSALCDYGRANGWKVPPHGWRAPETAPSNSRPEAAPAAPSIRVPSRNNFQVGDKGLIHGVISLQSAVDPAHTCEFYGKRLFVVIVKSDSKASMFIAKVEEIDDAKCSLVFIKPFKFHHLHRYMLEQVELQSLIGK